MKRNVKMSRTVGQLEKMFRMINTDFFDGKLESPIITIIPSSRSYGHYTTYNAWIVGEEQKREINIASGTLNRPLEEVASTLVHEMVHMYNDTVLQVQDCSRQGTYHNKFFKQAAETHGLNVERTDKYGWSNTCANDDLILWLCEHDEFNEIEINRPDYTLITTSGGAVTKNTTTTRRTNCHHRRYHCPCCGTVVRATKKVNIMCIDCQEPMMEG